MATRPLSNCTTPGCPNLVGRGRCPDCRTDRQRQQDAQRPSASARGYGSGWRRVRGAFLKAHPTCQTPGCSSASTEADHYPKTRAELVAAGELHPDAWRFLVARCKPCHSARTLAHLLGRPSP
jgi:5-methylcytosine-specific restriction protein A